jgi:hypothetical protein
VLLAVFVLLVLLVAITVLVITTVGVAGRMRTLRDLLLTTGQRMDTARQVVAGARAAATRSTTTRLNHPRGSTRTYDVGRP